MYSYTVRCSFKDDQVAETWLKWLDDEHIQDVINGGAIAAEIFKMDVGLCYEIRYQFESEQSFRDYEANHAPRLREKGLAKFPLVLGLEYSRTEGSSIRKFNC